MDNAFILWQYVSHACCRNTSFLKQDLSFIDLKESHQANITELMIFVP